MNGLLFRRTKKNGLLDLMDTSGLSKNFMEENR